MNRDLMLGFVVALGIGVVVTILLGSLVKRERTYVEPAASKGAWCAMVGSELTTETSYGFPLTFTKLRENPCAGGGRDWLPLGFVVNTAIMSGLVYGIFMGIKRKRHA